MVTNQTQTKFNLGLRVVSVRPTAVVTGELRSALSTYCAVLAGLTMLAWASAGFSQFALHLPFPWNWPLFDPSGRFSDLTENFARIQLLWRGEWGGPVIFVYPAPALLVFAFLSKLNAQPIAVFLTLCCSVYLAAAVLLRRAITQAGKLAISLNVALCLTVLCSYPALFQMDRGNIEILPFVFVLAGITCFAMRFYWAAAILFGIAGCIKPFPLLFLFLSFSKKLYRQAFLAGAIVFFVNLGSLFWIGPTIGKAYSALAADQRVFLHKFVLTYDPRAIHFDHSLFSCLKQAVRLGLGWSTAAVMESRLLTAYVLYMCFAVVFGIACLIYFWRKPVLNQLFAVTILMLVLPPISYDYTLVAIYFLWGAFMIHLLNDRTMKRPLMFLVPLAILMTPHSFLRFGNVGCGGQLNALLLLFLLAAAARIDMPSSLFGELPSSRNLQFEKLQIPIGVHANAL